MTAENEDSCKNFVQVICHTDQNVLSYNTAVFSYSKKKRVFIKFLEPNLEVEVVEVWKFLLITYISCFAFSATRLQYIIIKCVRRIGLHKKYKNIVLVGSYTERNKKNISQFNISQHINTFRDK
jgi:hypothetical protein